MERIFDPYFTTKEVGKGSGLGLAVVNGIVKRHNGAITVLSEPGKGTTFSVYIPRIETATAIPIETPHEALIGAESILLLDDEQAVVKMGSAILKRLGYKVTTETDSLRALEVFSAGPDEFDLIITDYAMPNLTGIALAREIRRIRPDMPILLCTGYSEKITSDSVRELGIELLLKPYRLRQISEVVRKYSMRERENAPRLERSRPRKRSQKSAGAMPPHPIAAMSAQLALRRHPSFRWADAATSDRPHAFALWPKSPGRGIFKTTFIYPQTQF